MNDATPTPTATDYTSSVDALLGDLTTETPETETPETENTVTEIPDTENTETETPETPDTENTETPETVKPLKAFGQTLDVASLNPAQRHELMEMGFAWSLRSEDLKARLRDADALKKDLASRQVEIETKLGDVLSRFATKDIKTFRAHWDRMRAVIPNMPTLHEIVDAYVSDHLEYQSLTEEQRKIRAMEEELEKERTQRQKEAERLKREEMRLQQARAADYLAREIPSALAQVKLPATAGNLRRFGEIWHAALSQGRTDVTAAQVATILRQEKERDRFDDLLQLPLDQLPPALVNKIRSEDLKRVQASSPARPVAPQKPAKSSKKGNDYINMSEWSDILG